MTTTKVVEMSVTVNNSPIQDYVHLVDHTQPTGYLTFNVSSFLQCEKKTLNLVKCNLTKLTTTSLAVSGS